MQTQFDHQVRVVSRANLEALCARVSGTCHRFEVSKVSRSRVHVTYSNPDEYGHERPVTAVFPCYPSTFDGDSNPAVVLEIARILGAGRDEYDPAQLFDPILAGPVLWRSPHHGADRWATRQEIDGTDRYLCPDGKVRTVDANHPYTNDRFAAFEITGETSAETFARIGGNRHFAYFSWSDLRPVREEQ